MVQRNRATQRILTNGGTGVDGSIFQSSILIQNFPKISEALHKHVLIADGTGPSDCIVVPRDENHLVKSANTIPYRIAVD